MATLLELCAAGLLEAIDPGLEPHEMPWRRLYGTPEFIRWLNDALPTIPHDATYADLSPEEQVVAVFCEYTMGEGFSDDRRFKKLSRTPSLHVWEIKTDDIRIFGWVPEKDAFICCFGDSKDDIATYQMYGAYMAKTHYVRERLDLDEPKSIDKTEYPDVISTKT